MLAVLVANTKGGCGKTTIATQLAGAFAKAGLITALADADRQHSSLEWTARRPKETAPVHGLDWVRDVGKAPRHTARLIIDAPAAMRPKQAEALVKMADMIVLPVLPSAFDEAATARFLDHLETIKPIRKNKKAVALVGNRMRTRTRAAARLDQYLVVQGHQVVTRLRDSALYSDTAARGLSLFDLRGQRAENMREDWRALLTFIENAA
ncbi:MAG: ParA family protein [Inquilinus sp.]|nr:ParA family protein [Inquilinus sp.]